MKRLIALALPLLLSTGSCLSLTGCAVNTRLKADGVVGVRPVLVAWDVDVAVVANAELVDGVPTD